MALRRRCGRCGQHVASGRRCPCDVARRQADYGPEHRALTAAAIADHPSCVDCGATDDLTGDHLRPLAAGGRGDPTRVVLCRRCNSRKRDR